jgi:hypothetical protein
MTARIGNSEWSATGAVVVNRRPEQNNYLGIAGTGFTGGIAYAVSIGMAGVVGPGTYSVAWLNPTGNSLIVGASTGNGWGTFVPGGTGSVVITTLTASRLVGSFTADAIPSGNGTVPLLVRNGQFDLTY